MATLMARVQKVLEKEFSPKEILLEPVGHGMVDGWVISKSFDGLSGLERQQKIHGLLDKYFNSEDRRRILTIFTLTPLEKRIIIDEDPEGSIQLPMKKTSSSVSKTTRRTRNGVVNRRRSAGNSHVARKWERRIGHHIAGKKNAL
jgi:acid stress-induced BolA-like protein IbaG/YrbA